MTELTEGSALALLANEEGCDPIENRLRAMVRQTIETMFEEELAEAPGRARYARGGKARGYRNGHRERELVGTFGTETVRVPRAGSRATMVASRNGARPRCHGIGVSRRKPKR